MDTGVERTREIPIKQIVRNTDTRDILARAARYAKEHKLEDYFIVDVDSHHFETQSWTEIIDYIPDPVIQDIAKNFTHHGQVTPGIIQASGWPTHQNVGGRIPHDPGLEEAGDDSGLHRDVVLARRAMDSMSINRQVMFPTPMLALGQHPEVDVEVAVAHGYNRWLVDKVLPGDDRLMSLLYLPFNDASACERMVEEFGGRKGVAGFMVTTVRYRPVHHNQYMRLYRMIEERGLPLGFHAGPNWGGDGYVRQLNRFITMHAISFPLANIVHLSNWVMNAIPERFPKLKTVWIESGVAWLAFMMMRLDNEYLMRSSEAPGLKRLPSDYIREMYFTTQPMERTDLGLLEAIMKSMKAETQLVYASDWPHWDFDTPSTILDLPFLTDQAKRNILGLNAKRLFKIAD